MRDLLVLIAVIASGYALVAFGAGMLADCAAAAAVWFVTAAIAAYLIARRSRCNR